MRWQRTLLEIRLVFFFKQEKNNSRIQFLQRLHKRKKRKENLEQREVMMKMNLYTRMQVLLVFSLSRVKACEAPPPSSFPSSAFIN